MIAAARDSTLALRTFFPWTMTATVLAVSSRYRRPAQVSPTVHTGPETAATSTAMRSALATCLVREQLGEHFLVLLRQPIDERLAEHFSRW